MGNLPCWGPKWHGVKYPFQKQGTLPQDFPRFVGPFFPLVLFACKLRGSQAPKGLFPYGSKRAHTKAIGGRINCVWNTPTLAGITRNWGSEKRGPAQLLSWFHTLFTPNRIVLEDTRKFQNALRYSIIYINISISCGRAHLQVAAASCLIRRGSCHGASSFTLREPADPLH